MKKHYHPIGFTLTILIAIGALSYQEPNILVAYYCTNSITQINLRTKTFNSTVFTGTYMHHTLVHQSRTFSKVLYFNYFSSVYLYIQISI